MQIHQFQVSFVAEQDRILVRMTSAEGEEQRLWLTRRMLGGLFPHLEKASEQLALPNPSPAGHDGAAQAALQAFQREEALQQTAFDTPFQSRNALLDDTSHTLLVTTAHIQLQGPDMLSVRFEETLPGAAESRQLEINMGNDTLVALLHVIGLAMRNSDWGINSPQGQEPTRPIIQAIETEAQPSEWDAFANAEPPKYLN